MGLEDVQETCDAALQQLETLFKPHCRLTLLMRNPHSEDGDLIFTRDDLGEVITAVERLKEKERLEHIKPVDWETCQYPTCNEKREDVPGPPPHSPFVCFKHRHLFPKREFA